MKKVFALLLVFTMLTLASTFKDVSPNHWAYKSVNYLVKRAIMSGYPGKLFKGNCPVTRFELAKILVNVLNYFNSHNVQLSNTDVATIQKLTVELSDQLALLGVKVSTLTDELNNLKKDIANLKESNGNYGLNFKGSWHTSYAYREFDNNYLQNTKKVKGSTIYHEWTLSFDKEVKKNVEVAATMWWAYINSDTYNGDSYFEYLFADIESDSLYFGNGNIDTSLDGYIKLKKFFKLGSLKVGRWKYKIGVDPIIYANRVDFAVEFNGNKNKEGINFKMAALNMKTTGLFNLRDTNQYLLLRNQSNTNMIFNAFYAQIDKKFNNKLNLAGWIYTSRNDDVASSNRIAPNFYGIEFKYPVEKKYNFTVFGNVIFEDANESRMKQIFGFNTVNADNLYKIGFEMSKKDDWKITGYLLQSDRNFGLNFIKDENGKYIPSIPVYDLRIHTDFANDDLFADGYYVFRDGFSIIPQADYMSNANIKTIGLEKKINDNLNLRVDYGRFDANKNTVDSFLQFEHDVYQGILTYKYSKSATFKFRIRSYDFDKVNGAKVARDYTDIKTEISVNF